MSNTGRTALALVAAAAVLVVAAWGDTGWVGTSHAPGASARWPWGSLAVAGGVLLLATLAWRSRSALVGTAYALVGGFFAFLPAIAEPDGAPSSFPAPIADVVNRVAAASIGLLNAVGVIGASMLLAGLIVIAWSFRDRRPGRSSAFLPGSGSTPT